MTPSTKKPTSQSSNQNEKSLFLRIKRDRSKEGEQYEWYVINPSNQNPSRGFGDGDNKLTVFSSMPRYFPENSCCVALKSIIYAVAGGIKTTTNPQVFYLDTRCPGLGWKKGPVLNLNKEKPVGAVLDGEIYIMGTPKSLRFLQEKSTNLEGLWAEILDPLLNESRTLSSRSTPKPSLHVSSAIEYGSKKLLVIFDLDEYPSSLYCYDMENNSWTLIEKKFGSHMDSYHNSFAVVDEILYCFSREVYAYDLENRTWFSGPIKGLDGEGVSPPLNDTNGWGSPELNHPEAHLVHVGNGKLCFVWPDCLDDDAKGMRVHCTKFRTYKSDDGRGGYSILHAIIESLAVHIIENVECSIVDCLAV